MADKEKRDSKEEESTEKAGSSTGKSNMKMILFAAIGAILLIGISIGVTMMLMNKSAHSNAEEDPEAVAADEAAPSEEDAPKKDKKGKKGKKKGSKEGGKAEGPKTTDYLALDPAFVVNFESSPQEARFLQVNVEVMTHDPAVVEDVKKHMPAIRNSIVLLLSSQNYKTLSTLEGKENVRAAVLTVIQKILTEQTGKPGVEAVYFTGFVMQ
jgi:flagellar FliL protein